MIEIKNLVKSYGKSNAVDNISFTVNSGEILGLLGPNGAGKSTTMNIITGYISATSGTVTIDGKDTVESAEQCRKMVGYLPEQPPLYMDMTVIEYLDFVYDIKKADQDRESHIDGILELVGISDVKNRLIKNLSKGYKQRVGIAQALIGDPEILILDEPTVGLDPKQILEIRNVIKELGKEHTVILSSHILSEVSAVCERIIIISNGKIVAEDTTENLSNNLSNYNKFVVRIAGQDAGQIEKLLKGIKNVNNVEYKGEAEPGAQDYLIESEKDADVRVDLFNALSAGNLPILMLKSMDMSLEEIFLKLTAGEEAYVESVAEDKDKEDKE